MTLKEVAHSFNMNLSEFSHYTGYSRQGLNYMFKSNKRVCSNRYRAMIKQLRILNDLLYEIEMDKLKAIKDNREKIIEQLEKRLEG